MATAPLINLFDGSGTTTSLNVTTNSRNLSFTGTVDSNVVDVQISINGSGFISDPSLVGLSLPSFSVPNPSSFPDGIPLERGQNTIALRSVDLSGSVSPVSTVVVEVVSDLDLGEVLAPPTGVRLQRKASSIEISWSQELPVQPAGVPPLDVKIPTSYNVYASTGAGGSGSGYLRINKDPIPSTSPTETVIESFPVAGASFDLDDDDPSTNLPRGSDLQIVARTITPGTGAQDQKILATHSLIQSPDFRLSYTISSLVTTKLFSFAHDRNAGVGAGILSSDTFSIVESDDPLFYVVTAVFFDKATGRLLESRFSQELAGAPLPLDTTVRGIRIREQGRVVSDYMVEIQKTSPTLSLVPGSTVREVHIEPFGNEAQKAYFLTDFVHRSKSFAALLQIDDPELTGTSVPVQNSAYKQQLRSAIASDSDAAVQALIDGAFDSLAQNFGVPREGKRPASVVQTFYTEVRPTRDLVVAQDAVVTSSVNKSAPRFRTRGSVTMTAANAQSFFNPDKRRYEIRIQMMADTPGSVGNVPANDLDTITSGASGFKTINDVASGNGRDSQSNLALSESALLAVVGVDAGTEGGYKKTASGSPGLLESKIVKSGDPFMMRDYDPVRHKHIGGKVDVYARGTIERTVVETFAFQFDVARSVRFDVIDPSSLTLRARDSRLTPSNPISEMLFNPSQDLGLRNHSLSPTESYDLTGVTLVDYRTIRLNTSIPQPITLLDDFVEGDYRFRSNNRFTASVQPIRRVTSVIGEVAGALDSAAGFTMFKTQDPLLEGESTIATDYITINQVDGKPSGASIQVNAEQHVLIGQFEEPLVGVGVNTFTVAVFSSDRSVQYKGPADADPDYLIIPGSQTRPIKIVRTTLSNIPTGSTVSIDYQKDENFRVTYVVNDVLQQLQSRINNGFNGLLNGRHVTADVLVKQALDNPLSVEMTIQLDPNADQAGTDSDVRTNVSILTDSRGIGNPIHQSDMTRVVDAATGVDYIVSPYTRFTLKDGSVRLRDTVLNDADPLPALNMFNNAVFILTQSLLFDTTDGGGPATQHHAVFKDELEMTMAQSLELVASGVNQSWIIGRLGAVIQGYSDDATLFPLFITPEAVAAERLRRTANRVVVSLDAGSSPPDHPSSHAFAATYIVSGDRGVKDITVSTVEFLSSGDLTLTYKAAV